MFLAPVVILPGLFSIFKSINIHFMSDDYFKLLLPEFKSKSAIDKLISSLKEVGPDTLIKDLPLSGNIKKSIPSRYVYLKDIEGYMSASTDVRLYVGDKSQLMINRVLIFAGLDPWKASDRIYTKDAWLEDLEISVRLYNSLKYFFSRKTGSSYGVRIGDLASFTREELMSARNIGKKTMDELDDLMGKCGMAPLK